MCKHVSEAFGKHGYSSPARETHEPKRLHAVLMFDGHLVDVANAGETSFGKLAVLLERLEYEPALQSATQSNELVVHNKRRVA